ncbi:hypothetical protein AVEN_218921-1 [Araneus ventricosus]|uniref:Uncharacterized protein n=1 Tax=Araneus ventricosus TaxID=182803 RepID=A0A4Y2NPA2_ARAVE|nr:hypothetical protein AVEN_218921-1 [Araneus ventricosus]
MQYKVRKHNAITKHDRRIDIRGVMTHALSAKTEKQQTFLPEFSLVQISMAERCALKTWSQMEVRAVMRYKSALGIVFKYPSIPTQSLWRRRHVPSNGSALVFSV